MPGARVCIGWKGPRISRGAWGFISQQSNWLGAPRLKIMIPFLARLLSTAPAACRAENSASPNPAPKEPTCRKSRRERPSHVCDVPRPCNCNMLDSDGESLVSTVFETSADAILLSAILAPQMDFPFFINGRVPRALAILFTTDAGGPCRDGSRTLAKRYFLRRTLALVAFIISPHALRASARPAAEGRGPRT